MPAGKRIESAADAAAIRVDGRKAHARLNRVVGPAIGDVQKPEAVARVRSALQRAAGDRPRSRVGNPRRKRAGIAASRKIIGE